ncbi:phospholipase-like protein [Tanacetum coccineum]
MIKNDHMMIRDVERSNVKKRRKNPSPPKKIRNIHGVSFLADPDSQDSQEEVSIEPQLPLKEPNLGIFTIPCTIGNFNFYALADLGASVSVLPRNIFEYLKLANLSNTDMIVEMADMRKLAPFGIVKKEYNREFKAWPSCDPLKDKCDGGQEIHGIDKLGKT